METSGEELDVPQLIPLNRVPDLIPSSRRGKRLAIGTVYRWVQRGRLATVKVGGSRYTTPDALSRFMAAGEAGAALSARAPSGSAAAESAGVQLDRLLA